MDEHDFHGCKVALFRDEHVLVFLRDDNPNIESPNMWDLPGGGREGSESPEACVLRELEEEFGLTFGDDRLTYKRRYHKEHRGRSAYFFVGHISQDEIDQIRFGDEGQGWSMMHITEYLESHRVVPRHKVRMADFLSLLEAG